METQIISLSKIFIDSIAESSIHIGQLKHIRTCSATAKHCKLQRRVLETQIISLSRICIDSIEESVIHSGQLQHSRTCFANAKRFELSTAAAAGLRAVFSFAPPMPPSRPLLVVVFINMFAKKIENFTNDALNIDGRHRHDLGRAKVIEV